MYMCGTGSLSLSLYLYAARSKDAAAAAFEKRDESRSSRRRARRGLIYSLRAVDRLTSAAARIYRGKPRERGVCVCVGLSVGEERKKGTSV